ncbi:MAG: hypothetical protein R6V20_04980 [Desulfobia sp.]
MAISVKAGRTEEDSTTLTPGARKNSAGKCTCLHPCFGGCRFMDFQRQGTMAEANRQKDF